MSRKLWTTDVARGSSRGINGAVGLSTYIWQKKIALFFLREFFCGPGYVENAFAAEASPVTQLGELTTLPETLWSARPFPRPHRTRRLDRVASCARELYTKCTQYLATPLP